MEKSMSKYKDTPEWGVEAQAEVRRVTIWDQGSLSGMIDKVRVQAG